MGSRLVWFITGTSAGFGEALTKIVLARGDRVIATARSLEKIQHLASTDCRTLQLDVTDEFPAIQAVAKAAVDVWGRVDVLVNNAGLGTAGISEELGAAGYQKAFAVNVFSAINVTNALLPYMRAAKSGLVVLMGSRHAWKTQFPGISAYGSTKAALHAWGEGLSSELKPFGVRVLIVQPGAHRTTILTTSHANPLGGQQLPDYEAMRQAGAKRYIDQNGKQPNDPVKAMTAVVDVIRGEGQAAGKPTPLWLVLGQDAENDLREHVKVRLESLEEWKDITRSVAVDDDDVVLI
ncbi:hypothetical protein PHLGIDRAFT_119106 [Phlebiopsis gigantea 11061_1 CR5-6]|uniref:Uncharacterized protein n=1 Tax=Phlebiopsis gigantea (strain 11061_1 CR5-6) TaxID=745531 RepID=A0A0C3NMQ4_PHLG1|nr:hypothetical protein PHLGIDRAFT_119106 [Phlebiopsis gigantea 11061_1 CR5-6]